MKKDRSIRQICAWIMTVCLVASICLIPKGKAEAATATPKVVDLELGPENMEYNTEYTVDDLEMMDNMVDIGFVVPEDYNTTAKLEAAGLTKLLVKYEVISYTPAEVEGEVEPEAPQTIVYSMFGGDDTNWEDAEEPYGLVVGETTTEALELPISSAANLPVGYMGIRFVNITGSFTYKIISARLVGNDYVEEAYEEPVEIEKPCVIDISKLPGGAKYTDDDYLKNLYVEYTSEERRPTAVFDDGELTLLLGTDYKLVGINDKLTVTFKTTKQEGNACDEGIVLDNVTVKEVDAEVPVKLSGNTVVKGDVKAKDVEISSGIVSVSGNISAKDNVTITDGKVSVENGIKSEGTVVVGSKAVLLVNVKNGENGNKNSAISGANITIENGADITAGDVAKANMFSVTPKNEKGENVDVSKYTGEKNEEKTPDSDKENKENKDSKPDNGSGNSISGQGTDAGDKNKDVKTTEQPVATEKSTEQAGKATDMAISGTVKGVKDVDLSGTYQLALNKSMVVMASFSPEEALSESIVLTSSAPKVVSVSGTTLTAKKTGTAKITVTSKSGLVKEFSVKVVSKSVGKVKIKATKKTVKKGKTIKLKATTTPSKSSSNKIYWKSSKESIATVTKKGVVKGVKKGKVKISAIALDGSGKKATVTITVK